MNYISNYLTKDDERISRLSLSQMAQSGDKLENRTPDNKNATRGSWPYYYEQYR